MTAGAFRGRFAFVDLRARSLRRWPGFFVGKRQVAANSGKTAGKAVRGRPFAKGQSGNPTGRPKAVAEVQALAREYSSVAIERLAKVAQSGKSEAAVVAACNALLDRAYGKPVQPLAGDGDGGPVNARITVEFVKPGSEPPAS